MLGHNLGCPVGTLPDNLLCGDPSQTEKDGFRVPARKELHMGRNNSMQKPSIVTRLKSDQAVAVEFPIVKDTTPNITNSRLNNIP